MLPTETISEAESISFSSPRGDPQQKQDPKGERDSLSLLWAERAGAEPPASCRHCCPAPRGPRGIQSHADTALVCREHVAEGLPERPATAFTVSCCTLIIL